jgi:hypothetical protein
VPISIDGSEPPLGFRQFHCVTLSGNGIKSNSAAMKSVLLAVDALMKRVPAQTAASPSSGRSSGCA